MLDFEQKNLREATFFKIQQTKILSFTKAVGANFTQKHEKVAQKQIELNGHRNSKIFWAKFHSTQVIVIISAYPKMNGE